LELKEAPEAHEEPHVEHLPEASPPQNVFGEPLISQPELPMQFESSFAPSPIQRRELIEDVPMNSASRSLDDNLDEDIDFVRNQTKRKKKMKKYREANWDGEDMEIL